MNSIYKYNAKLAAKYLLKSFDAMKNPPNYWRTLEYKLVLNEGKFNRSDLILDIGSPKLLSLYLSKVIGAQVFTTDINDYFIKDLSFLREFEGIDPQQLQLRIEDGRKISFDDGYFNKVYSISVIEHIPDSGDIECMKEIARVLANKGRCIMTVPFSVSSRIDYKKEKDFYWSEQSPRTKDGRIFFQRRYCEQDLYDRIIYPSGLILEKLQFIGEKVLTKSKKELIDVLPQWTSPIEPLLSKLFLTKPVNSWESLKKPLCAFIVLRKESSH